MPYVREWQDPDVVAKHENVVVHHWYGDDDDNEDPIKYIYAIYKPNGFDSRGPRFGDLECVDPIETFDIRELCKLVNMPAFTIDISSYTDLEGEKHECQWEKPTDHRLITYALIDKGFISQAGINADAVGSYEPPDTLTIPLPFDSGIAPELEAALFPG